MKRDQFFLNEEVEIKFIYEVKKENNQYAPAYLILSRGCSILALIDFSLINFRFTSKFKFYDIVKENDTYVLLTSCGAFKCDVITTKVLDGNKVIEEYTTK